MVVQYLQYADEGNIFRFLGKDLRIITVIGEIDDDDITDIDLLEIDKRIDDNGFHLEIDDSLYNIIGEYF